ncbi:DUF3006 domain-containing protein [Bacillus litorisediminis]|uniref:DUF3006 domain-containing protein n=1 Tax=Bacillus litorisediminis TaxID=2922713 RepID=UPI001FADD904|nr:DUF3006 domain-containing protein [Bacillus litorisediminis]
MNINKFTVDRFEGNSAVLLLRDDEKVEKVIQKGLLNGVREGDIIEVTFGLDGSFKSFVILEEETQKQKDKAKRLLEKLKNKQ